MHPGMQQCNPESCFSAGILFCRSLPVTIDRLTHRAQNHSVFDLPVATYLELAESWSVSPFSKKKLCGDPTQLTYVVAYMGSKKDLVGVQPMRQQCLSPIRCLRRTLLAASLKVRRPQSELLKITPARPDCEREWARASDLPAPETYRGGRGRGRVRWGTCRSRARASSSFSAY